MDKLAQLRQMTTVVADTADVEAVKRLKPMDCTTNPTIVLKALKTPIFHEEFEEALEWGSKQAGSRQAIVEAVADRLAVAVGLALLREVPGRISTEVDAELSFDTQASIRKGQAIVKAYGEHGVERGRILIKLAATWEGIRAAEVLQKQGIDCNLTLVFSTVQAVACADANAFLISPFVGRILDWHTKATGQEFGPEHDPGVKSVIEIYNYYKTHDIRTVVMGASFRNVGQIEALAGCDRLTISAPLLEQLAASSTVLERKLSPEMARPVQRMAVDEKTFRWIMNDDAMATEKLAEGIRAFAKDLYELRRMIQEQLDAPAKCLISN
ncbi:MAG: transaldolase [Mesorhizobium sp.]|uniref:transaldolase n=1 Tax=unclassified Mesorhizobium TaxID=325217 RepID=UPI000FEA1F96|nr:MULTISPECIES: transaldolase [unclassified Mesorhizobium]RWE36046.1 MAG: transaldolase [Mesorhizobium sp.]TGP87882.1 transaldolase [Mesorhizobium sp. M8A.F.Ca.ET.218.01.1.1]TGT15680.1 transaldolase [Mesorhizobium sp. M8A.F.Ca.ET.213.01.1.1]